MAWETSGRGRRMAVPAMVALVAALAINTWARGGHETGQAKRPRPQPPMLGALCATHPSSMAVGVDGSLYLQEGGFGNQGGASGDMILHFSAAGDYLGSLGPTDTSVATDRAGDIYCVLHGRLRKLSPAGKLSPTGALLATCPGYSPT